MIITPPPSADRKVGSSIHSQYLGFFSNKKYPKNLGVQRPPVNWQKLAGDIPCPLPTRNRAAC